MSVLFKSYKKILQLFILSASLGITTSYAQSIKGTVVDARSGEPLVGANITITGTNNKTAVKLDGSYLFKNVTPGTYQLTVAYVGFRQKHLKSLPLQNQL